METLLRNILLVIETLQFQPALFLISHEGANDRRKRLRLYHELRSQHRIQLSLRGEKMYLHSYLAGINAAHKAKLLGGIS